MQSKDSLATFDANKISQYCLVGRQIANSLSPMIHKLFAREFGLKLEYKLLTIDADEVIDTIKNFFINNGSGMNITAPYKELALSCVDRIDQNVYGAINTIYKKDNILYGANTDGIGLIHDLAQKKINLHQKTILILGSGGVVKNILPEILKKHPEHVYIASRKIDCAYSIINKLLDQRVSWIDIYSELPHASVTIHALSSISAVTIYKNINFIDTVAYDLNYHAQSPFLDFASKNGANQIFNGLGMLLAQAAEAFYLWHGVYPSIDKALPKLENIST